MAEYGEVKFVWKGEPTGEVSVVGSWNAWKEGKQLAKSEESEEYFVVLSLPRGRYEYKFCIDSQWWTHDDAQPSVTNEFGSYNNVMIVEENKLEEAEEDKLGSHDQADPAEGVNVETEMDFLVVNGSKIARETADEQTNTEWVMPLPPSGSDAADILAVSIEEALVPCGSDASDIVVVSLEETLPPDGRRGTDAQKADTNVIHDHETLPHSGHTGNDIQKKAIAISLDETSPPGGPEDTHTQKTADTAVPDDETAQRDLCESVGYLSWITEAIFGKTSE